LAAGGAALAVALVLAATGTMPRRREPADAGPPPPRSEAPVTGLLMAAAALWVIGQWRAPTPAMLVGLAGVAGVAAASRLPGWPRPALTAPLAAMPFAGLLALAPGVPSTGWVRALVVGGVAAGAMAAARTDAMWDATGLTPVLYAITAFGVFAAVPDTEEAAVLLGASVPAVLCGWPLGRARLGPAGAAGAAALMVWVSAVGGRGRLPSIVGAVACLGLLVTLPAGRWLADRWLGRTVCAGDPAVLPPVLVLAAQAATVAVASRVAGISSELRVAVPTAVGITIAALAASAWLTGHRWRSSRVRDM
jgi:hypothetical protein